MTVIVVSAEVMAAVVRAMLRDRMDFMFWLLLCIARLCVLDFTSPFQCSWFISQILTVRKKGKVRIVLRRLN